ncbi:N-formylglutamate amidohydrolase [Thiocystis violacea]|uniref:N-formylglutamate amidohydrolase n=1 Tax=Thiocystis violacea TaxID=13725 RepID=UPI0019075105|nr:N-formylglutamate amidohydrolase [Thiocystis violacea]MBK1720476.1 N-formylglutamate amidohydrolase [Thiocystis violacea]
MRSNTVWDPSRQPDPWTAGGSSWLDPDEPPPFEVVNPLGTANALLVCDHASNRIPRRLGDLGLSSSQLSEHIAWDPGAAAVARGLAARLDATLILGGYSRLVIDLNRPLESPELIPTRSDGIEVPGNQDLDPLARAARIAALFQPYHQAIARRLDAHPQPSPRLLSLHSFTPVLAGQRRPWPIGLAHGRDPRLARRLRRTLVPQGDWLVGDNQPYAVEDAHDFTLPTHGEGRGIPHLMIEIRQDGLLTAASIAAWVERLALAYEGLGEG